MRETKTLTIASSQDTVDKYPKSEVLMAIQWMFGISKQKAVNLYNSTDASYHNEIVRGFKSNARSSFYEC